MPIPNLQEYGDDVEGIAKKLCVRWLFNLLTRDPTADEIEKAHEIISFYIGSIENVNSQITEEYLKGIH